ncbi:MAG TPA: agmatinase [Candidatus Brocadiia bacterium]|nr:agmatinase [Planctomycetota bacterium]MDO8093590.1 agmatinase [Candidatus Brocadiales bacterium]
MGKELTSSEGFVRYNFGALPENLSQYETSTAVILPVPYDSTSSYRAGTREGPRAIIAASRQVELFDEELLEDVSLRGIHTLGELIPDMRGPERMIEKVRNVSREILTDKKMLVTLGGEHSITLGIVQALLEKYPNLSILQIDAHLDMRESYEESIYNHACVMRRIFEICNNIVQVGIRNFSQEEHLFIKAQGIKPFYALNMYKSNKWHDDVVARLGPNVYITIDLDGLDPSIMPSVSTPEPGGMGWYDTLRLLRMVCEQKKVVGFDVMELCPNPTDISSDFTAAKLVYKLIGYATLKR